MLMKDNARFQDHQSLFKTNKQAQVGSGCVRADKAGLNPFIGFYWVFTYVLCGV